MPRPTTHDEEFSHSQQTGAPLSYAEEGSADSRRKKGTTAASKRRGLAVFLGIAFGGTWLWLLFATKALGVSPVNPLLQLPAFCVPGIGAVIVRKWVSREGFADAGLTPRFRAARRYYALALLGPVALTAVTLWLAALLGLWTPDLAGPGGLLPGVRECAMLLLMMLIAVATTPLYWGEEFGWTSYLRPRLFPGHLWLSTLTTGFIWAVWHYPLAFIGYIEFSNVLVGLLIWTLSFQLQEIILTWLYLRSGSVWVASLAHAGNNMVLFLLLGQYLDQEAGLGPALPMLLSAIPMAAVCGWIAASRRRPDRTKRHDEETQGHPRAA